MPDGVGLVIGVLALGYVLLLSELFLPGGIAGAAGFVVVLYGCWLAFDLGPGWGSSAIVSSVVFTGLGIWGFFHSRLGKRMVLSDRQAAGWKAQESDLAGLVGRTGVAISPLRPAGLVDVEGRRVDVVTDSEFLATGQRVRVVEVEGNRVVVEAIAE